MKTPKKKLVAVFYSLESGTEPVREWLLELEEEERKTIGSDIMSIEFAWPIGMPTVRLLGKGLWEVRSHLKDKIARVFFGIKGKHTILLNALMKKSQQAPKKDIDLDRKRLKAFGE